MLAGSKKRSIFPILVFAPLALAALALWMQKTSVRAASAPLVGRWTFEAFTGGMAVSTLRANGTCSTEYSNSSASSKPINRRWKSDGENVIFYDVDNSLVGNARDALGFDGPAREVWRIQDISDSKVVLRKSDVVLVMSRPSEQQATSLRAESAN